MSQSAGPVVCQSCAMPMVRREDHGSDADGSPNHEFCTHCYQGGAFTAPDMTFDEMADFLRDFMIGEQGIAEELAGAAARMSITGLKRWG